MEWTPLPIRVENFEEIITKGYYYVDKTLLIKDLIDLRAKVNLFTRPRRFGKTLNMSMLRYFFEKSDEDRSRLFAGTKIMGTGEKYLEEQGQYPVISLSLKSMKQASYESAFYCLKEDISREFKRHCKLDHACRLFFFQQADQPVYLFPADRLAGDYDPPLRLQKIPFKYVTVIFSVKNRAGFLLLSVQPAAQLISDLPVCFQPL